MAVVQQRRVGRERAIQALFSLENASPADLDLGLERFWQSVEEPTSKGAMTFAEELIRGVISHREDLDASIQTQSDNWKVERMAKVDRNVLRLGAFELLHTETPGRVVINEAIEVARTFGAESSPAFVNGILDKLARASGRI